MTALAVDRLRLYLIDDHDIVLEGLESILGREPDMEVVGRSRSAEDALAPIGHADPDIVLVDHRLPGMSGIDLCREIAERRLRARVVVLSAFLDNTLVNAALMVGARACVIKDIEADVLKQAIREVGAGRTFMDPQIADRMGGWATGRGDELRPSHLRVLRLLSRGHTNIEIAKLAGLSPHTVKSYLDKIYEILGVRGRSEAAAVALRRGLL